MKICVCCKKPITGKPYESLPMMGEVCSEQCKKIIEHCAESTWRHLKGETPENYQKVEVLVEGKWLPATFVAADSITPSDPVDGDELWWMDYFLLEDGDTIPEDIHSGDELPEWRKIDQ